MAAAHKSFLNTFKTQTDKERQQVKHAMVVPTPRTVDAQNIVIQIPSDSYDSICGDVDKFENSAKFVTKPDKVEYVSSCLKKLIKNEYPMLKPKKEDEESEKRKNMETDAAIPTPKKRKTIVFDVNKKFEETEKTKTVEAKSASANSVTRAKVSTVTKTHKYDRVPPLSTPDRKLVWCRMFPACRYGSACAFAHPRCKFMAHCSRSNCVYSHSPNASTAHSRPFVTPRVFKAAYYKPISTAAKNKCMDFPNCANRTCGLYHPKACRYGKECPNILCPFYHVEVSLKWYD